MVKAVVGDETQLKFAEDRLSRSAIPAQVGLVIGKLNSTIDRGFVFDLVPTPPNDAGEPACSLSEAPKDDKKKKGPKTKSLHDSSSSLLIDQDWVVEHARQVSRMLVGGMKVIGIYIWASESSFKNSTIILCQTVKGVADAASILETDRDEGLLIHICYSPMKWTCRNCMLASNITSSSLRPCDFKMGRVLSSIQTFRCMYNFDIRLPIYHDSASNAKTLTDILRYGISIHAKELRGAKAMIDGCLVVGDEPCSSDGLHEVELLLPFMKDASVEACSQKEVVGILVFSGSVCSFACLNPKEPISQALVDIKGDIIMSLQSRLDIICDEADGDVGPTDDGCKEANDEISTGKPVSQLVLHLLSFLSPVCYISMHGQFYSFFLSPNDYRGNLEMPLYGGFAHFGVGSLRHIAFLPSLCLAATFTAKISQEMAAFYEPYIGCVIDLQKGKQQCLSFPRRVFVPWLAGTYICDYLQPYDTVEVLKDHCVELMSMEAPTDPSTFLEPEIEAPTLATKSFLDVAVPFNSAFSSEYPLQKRETGTREESNRKPTKSADLTMIVAVLLVFLSIFVGWVLFAVRAS